MTDWQPVRGWEGLYEVSREGGVRKVNGTPVGQWYSQLGYKLVRLSKPRRMVRVHRIVAEAFVPNPLGLPMVNHIDSRRDNNDASNLEWCTQKQNLEHARRLGRMAACTFRGRRPSHALLTDEQVTFIRDHYAAGSVSHEALATSFGVSKRTIGRVINRRYYANV